MSRARTNKRGSISYQINQRMRQMDRIGESRHEAKRDYRENIGENKQGKTIGIHSYGTFETYKSCCKQFVKWANENYKGIRNIEDVKEEHIKEYIKHREEEGKSAWTYSKDLSALNKIFGTDVEKKDCDVANRSYHDITNNREMKEHHSHINYDNYKDEISVLQSTGMRRENIEKVSANSFNYDEKGYPVSIRLQDERAYGGVNMEEKGGRPREAEIPYCKREELKQIIDSKLEESGGDRDKQFFDHVPDRLGCHRFRQEYAETMYNQYLKEHGESTDWRGFDRNAMNYVSKNLGHNREDVVKYNYLSAR